MPFLFVLIAGQALARGLTLVTANGREFARVADLLWEDWSQAAPPSRPDPLPS